MLMMTQINNKYNEEVENKKIILNSKSTQLNIYN